MGFAFKAGGKMSKRLPRSRHRGVWLLGLAMACLPAQQPVADILVLKDGSRVETNGPWEVRGRQVVFELPNGTLSALRTSEIDLEASESATHDQKARRDVADTEQAQGDRARPESVLVVTNESLGLSPEGGEIDAPEDDGAPGGSASPGAISSEGDVRIVDWSYDAVGEDPVYEVTGVLENQGRFAAEALSVYLDIVAVDEETGLQTPNRHILRRARVQVEDLAPGATTEFRYGVTAADLRTHGEEGFSNPVVSFDVQFHKGAAPVADEDAVSTVAAAGTTADAGDGDSDSDDVDDSEDFSELEDDFAEDDELEEEALEDDEPDDDAGGLFP